MKSERGYSENFVGNSETIDDVMRRYGDIINLPHHEPTTHPRMSREARAAQFSPFIAQTGYEEEIQEAARATETRTSYDENVRAELDWRLHMLAEHANDKPDVAISFFIPDEHKEGGAIRRVHGRLETIDTSKRFLRLEDDTLVELDSVVELDSPLFSSIDY